MRTILLYAGVSFSITISAFSQTLEQQEQNKAIEKVLRDLDRAKSHFESASKDIKFQCMAAIANDQFCECIKRNIPFVLNFIDYVTIVSKSTAELGYDKMTLDDRKVIDATRRTRETCVNLR